MKRMIFVFVFLLGLSAFADSSKAKSQVIDIQVTKNGFEPNSIDVTPGVPVLLQVTRKTASTCATEIRIPEKKIKMDLPLNKSVSIDLGILEKGEIRFACGMDMEGGIIHVH